MTRIRGKGPPRATRVSPDGQFVLVPNPTWKGKAKGKRSGVLCHDRTPYMTVGCNCGYQMHVHESQFAAMADEDEILTRCHSCGGFMTLRAGWVRAALAEMWE